MEAEHQYIILYGSGRTRIPVNYKSRSNNDWKSNKPYEGVIGNLERRLVETDSNSQREKISKYQSSVVCETCDGKRLRPEALAVRIDGLTIADATAFSIEEALDWFNSLDDKLSKQQRAIGARILKEINERLEFLVNVGLDYLNLSRKSGTLSGGESQRIRLASQIGSGLTGVLYVLDEPSIGLHQRDNNRLLDTLRCAACAISATPYWSWNMMRTPSAPPIISSIWARALACMAGRSSPKAR